MFGQPHMLCMMEDYASPLMRCAQVCDLSWAGSASAPKKGAPDAVSGCRAPEIHGIVGSKLNWLKSIWFFKPPLVGVLHSDYYPSDCWNGDGSKHVIFPEEWADDPALTGYPCIPGFDPSSVAQASSAGGISNSRSTKCGMGTMLSFSISMSFWSGWTIKRFLDGPSVLMCWGWLEGWYLQPALSGTCLRLV